jgi:transcriptional regulator with XRE-family HTH domain
MKMDLSDRLTQAIAARGLTQAAVAEAVGASAGAVSAWCSGRKPPRKANIEALAGALDVPAAWLQFGEGDGPAPDRARERAAYRESVLWYHREAPPDLGRELGNAAGFAFDNDLQNLARETGQNTGDEALEGQPTVDLIYDVIELSGSDLDQFLKALKIRELRPHLEAAAHGDQKANQAIAAGLESLDHERRLTLIRIADYNATGLTGPEYDSGRFMAVCRNTLDSHKATDTAGGSFGLGKATMWSSSSLGLVITNSKLSVPEGEIVENRLFARLEIPWHEYGGEPWAGPAWYGEWDAEKKCTRSVAGNATLAHDLYAERESAAPGTTFVIVGAFDPSGEATTTEQMAAELIEAMAENFWAAMAPRGSGGPPRLRASVRTFRGRKKLSERVVDPDDYVPELVEALRKHYDDEVVDALDVEGDVVRETVTLRVPERLGDDGHPATDHQVVVLVAQAADPGDDSSNRETVNRVRYLRGSNMTIRDYALTGLPLGARPFHAIVLAGLAADGSGADDRLAERFLRAAEPPAHDRWMATPELTTRYARGARAALTALESDIKDVVREAVRPGTSEVSDGPDSLKQLLRLVPPKDTAKRPRVRSVSAKPTEDGAWAVEATVSVPARTGPWRFSPVLKFGTESGPALPVKWSELEALEGAEEVDTRRLRSRPGVRSVRFRAISDPTSHPVTFEYARVGLDLMDARREEDES